MITTIPRMYTRKKGDDDNEHKTVITFLFSLPVWKTVEEWKRMIRNNISFFLSSSSSPHHCLYFNPIFPLPLSSSLFEWAHVFTMDCLATGLLFICILYQVISAPVKSHYYYHYTFLMMLLDGKRSISHNFIIFRQYHPSLY